ncbi:hypothetical protein V8C37DRAFT_413325 [Trichoderma ceciliae]
MSIRNATCEPCRRAKLAYLCVYRARPFRRKSPCDRRRDRIREQRQAMALTAPPLETSPITEVLGSSSSRPRRYPDPGYLGVPIHASIFNQVTSRASSGLAISQHDESVQPPGSSPPVDTFIDQVTFDRANYALSLLDQLQGTNSALAEPFREQSTPVGTDARDASIGISQRVTVLLGNTHRTLGRRGLIKALTYIGDCSLETCIALNYLNDLQLVLQYGESHSPLASYQSWRCMGDVASSLFALGNHEKIDEQCSDIPLFVAELRRSCFARIYAADESLATPPGRPPRTSREFCYFQLPMKMVSVWGDTNPMKRGSSSPLSSQMMSGRERGFKEHNDEQVLNYTSDTFCSAVIASIKEEVLRLFCKRHAFSETDIINELRLKIDQQWQDLPSHYRLTTSLKDCPLGPFATDFLAGARLEYLETIILRDRMTNSETCLIWKVAQYGVPATGIISLAFLNSTAPYSSQFSRSKMIQALSVLVAEITIEFTRLASCMESTSEGSEVVDSWDPYINLQSWELEMGFWVSLAEHPTVD